MLSILGRAVKKETNKRLIVEALYFSLEDLKQSKSDINPFTATADKISGLKGRTRLQTVYLPVL